MPNFSIIIPTYKRRELLARCLEALTSCRQGMPQGDYEVIIGDDERSPETESIVSRSLPNARYVAGPSRGPAANRNHASAQADGQWLVFTDDDCIPQANWLQSFAAAIRPSVEVYEGKTTCKAGLRSPLEHAPANEKGGCLWSCNMMVSAELFKKAGGFDDGFATPAMEDVDFRERLKDANKTTLFVPSAVVDHPPRRIKGLRELIVAQESSYRFLVLKRSSQPKLISVISNTLKARLRACSRPNYSDLPRATAIFAAELIVLAVRAPIWHRRFSKMAKIEEAKRQPA